MANSLAEFYWHDKPHIAKRDSYHGPMMSRTSTLATLRSNLRLLMELRGWSQTELSKRSGVAQKTISNILNENSGVKSPQLDKVEAIAKAFGLNGWQLIMPNLPRNLLDSSRVSTLIDDFLAASSEGRELITAIASREHSIASGQ